MGFEEFRLRFTFGICSDYSQPNRLAAVISSIQRLQISDCEILVIGSPTLTIPSVRQIPFDETIKSGWLTKKKNTLVNQASHENVVVLHDYFEFDPGWYDGFLAFGDDWEICCNPQHLIDGRRHFTDWVTWDDPDHPRYTPLPYSEQSRTRYQYVSGGYYVVKKHVEPLNEALGWGELEDVEWSLRVREHRVIVCNAGSVVRHNKRHRDC